MKTKFKVAILLTVCMVLSACGSNSKPDQPKTTTQASTTQIGNVANKLGEVSITLQSPKATKTWVICKGPKTKSDAIAWPNGDACSALNKQPGLLQPPKIETKDLRSSSRPNIVIKSSKGEISIPTNTSGTKTALWNNFVKILDPDSVDQAFYEVGPPAANSLPKLK